MRRRPQCRRPRPSLRPIADDRARQRCRLELGQRARHDHLYRHHACRRRQRRPLRAEVALANSHSGADTIIFDPSLSGTLRLTHALPTITDNLTASAAASPMPRPVCPRLDHQRQPRLRRRRTLCLDRGHAGQLHRQRQRGEHDGRRHRGHFDHADRQHGKRQLRREPGRRHRGFCRGVPDQFGGTTVLQTGSVGTPVLLRPQATSRRSAGC